jgi:hypothetical protein
MAQPRIGVDAPGGSVTSPDPATAQKIDPATLAKSLAQLTSGWKPVGAVAPEALTAARQALASSILAGKTLSDIHSTSPSLKAGTPSDPALESELVSIASRAIAAPQPTTVAVVRSALAASLSNPSGTPAWAQGAQVVQSFGPFQDLNGVPHWVDLLLFTVSTQFAFGNASSQFGVFPISRFLLPPQSPTELALGAGSVWFLANLLSTAFPAGSFTGFSITGGTLASTSPLSLQNGIYVVPAGATLTLTATLAPATSPASFGDPGADAAAAVFTPPASVTIAFKQSSAAFQTVADSSAEAYGTTIALSWNQEALAAVTGLPQLLVPCSASLASFDFLGVQSKIFTPSGTAPISQAGWVLPLAATSITTLPEAAGPGTGLIRLSTGASIAAQVQAGPLPVNQWLVEIGTGGLYIQCSGKAASTKTTYQMWPEAAPSKLNASLDFCTNPTFDYAYLASSTNELLLTLGKLIAHLDRPLSAAGSRIPYQANTLLFLDQGQAATILVFIAARADEPKPIISIALENALLGVDAPAVLIVGGTLQGTALSNAALAMYFDLRWLLPTLPDPYAANFDLSVVTQEAATASVGTLLAAIVWAGQNAKPVLGFELLPAVQAAAAANVQSQAAPAAAPAAAVGDRGTRPQIVGPALLDLSTRVDLFGVALAPEIAALVDDPATLTNVPAQGGTDPGNPSSAAPFIGFDGMTLALNGAVVATFALPQVSWEPMESTAADVPGPIEATPASDGYPLVIAAPNAQQLVPFIPSIVLLNNIENVASGIPFAAVFSLPFGLDAVIVQPNRTTPGATRSSTFIQEGGQFRGNTPRFPEAIPPSPPTDTSPGTPPANPPTLTGAVQLTLMPPSPGNNDAAFAGFTAIDNLEGPAPGYGDTVIGAASGVATIFENFFGPSGVQKSVPLRRIDFSGYGASIFSEWTEPAAVPPAIIKVQFDTSIGRTSYEVIKAASEIYPYCVRVVRTITMQRQNAAWVKRTDSGWQAASQGLFQFPPDTATQWEHRIHLGALVGVYNVRNIRDQTETISIPSSPFQFKQVLFDADLGINNSLNVKAGGFTTTVTGVSNPPIMVASQDLIGYVQVAPDAQSPTPAIMAQLFAQIGALTPAISCVVEAGSFNSQPGTVFRCSAFEVDIITEPASNPNQPALGVALRGAPQIPRGGGWSMGQRKYTDTAPSSLPNDFPVPLVQPESSTSYWYIADVTDVLQLTQPDNFYSLLHSTGTDKVLFESPQLPTSASVSPPPPGPGLQFPKPNPPGPPKPGAVPVNAGSPNLGDIASVLNSTGLFPDIASALSLIQSAIEQINTIAQGFKYSKTYNFDPTQQVTLIDLGVLSITLQYADTTKATPQAAQLVYTVDSSASPSWSLSIGTLSFLVTVPMFGSSPVLTITGGFGADEHTPAGLKNLNVQLGDALSVVKSVFSDLQALAQYLPGGAGANLDVALSDGVLTVNDTFTINDMPLGLGNLTDISLDLGLSVQIQPLSVDFTIGIGDPGNPFNWIVDPLAGNGLIDLGVQNNLPALTIQAGIGLGLTIDLGIASGSASITIAFQLDIAGSGITLMAILTGQASVSVLGGLASASITLSAGIGFGLKPLVPSVTVSLSPPSLTIGSETITLLATCSVGIHITICWVISIGWDGSWQFSQSVSTPSLTIDT